MDLSILSAAGITGRPNYKGEFPLQFCPYHEHRRRSPSLSFNQNNGFCCYSCGAKGSVERFVRDAGFGVYNYESGLDDISWEPEPVTFSKVVDETRSDSECAEWSKFYHPYMAQRGFDKPTCRMNKIGYDVSEGRVTIPVYFNGNYYGSVKRTVLDETPKYTQPRNFPRRNLIYLPPAQPERSDVFIVQEGPFNAIRATQFGFRGGATFGCMPSQEQINIILNRPEKRIIICPDPDEAGKQSLLCWAEYDVEVMTLKTGDTCEVSQHEFEFALESAVPVLGALF